MLPVEEPRQVIDGIFHRLGTGVQLRELPKRFGPWQIAHKRQGCGRPTAPGTGCCSKSQAPRSS
ncbi:transposase [Streptomyces sp. NPDC056987]|uniref:transposase n=1 Tax=Streptomyces sp. NPDC056987 TaxID=3345988 RepID=UPI0036281841